jgi:hypothetical protein
MLEAVLMQKVHYIALSGFGKNQKCVFFCFEKIGGTTDSVECRTLKERPNILEVTEIES